MKGSWTRKERKLEREWECKTDEIENKWEKEEWQKYGKHVSKKSDQWKGMNVRPDVGIMAK